MNEELAHSPQNVKVENFGATLYNYNNLYIYKMSDFPFSIPRTNKTPNLSNLSQNISTTGTIKTEEGIGIGTGSIYPHAPLTVNKHGGSIRGKLDSLSGFSQRIPYAHSPQGDVFNYRSYFQRAMLSVVRGQKGNSSSAVWDESNAGGVGIWSKYSIWTQEFITAGEGALVSSDSRIKTNIRDISDGNALEILKKLKPVRYEYIDKTNIEGDVIGFIADEVQEHLPHAVRTVENRIPNIYQIVDCSGDYLTFDASYNVSSISNENPILLMNENDTETICEILEIDASLNRVKVDKTEQVICRDCSGSLVLVYGELVDDFRTLCHDYIFTITTAAVQEIDRLQQADKLKIAELEARLAALERNK